MSDSIIILSSVIIQKSWSYILPSSNILFIFTSLSFQALSTSFSNVSYESIIIIYIYIAAWWILREKCPYSEFLWSVFSRIRTEYENIRSISPYLVQMRENVDQKNF